MSMVFFISTAFYWIGVFAKGERSVMSLLGSRLAWLAVAMALIGTMVRWYESYLLGPDIGHIPVSNLYEVFVMFCWMTAIFYLYYEQHYDTRALGGFVMLVVSAAVGFLLWYTLVRQAHEIQPLVPALKSLVDEAACARQLHRLRHVCAVGHGGVRLSDQAAGHRDQMVQACAAVAAGRGPVLRAHRLRKGATENGGSYWMVYFGISALIVAGILFSRKRIAARLPSFEILDDVMYKAIAVGFAFFTIATVLGALWAAEAWGGYWSLGTPRKPGR